MKNSKKRRRAPISAEAWNDPRIRVVHPIMEAFPQPMRDKPNWAFYRFVPNEDPKKKPVKVLCGIHATFLPQPRQSRTNQLFYADRKDCQLERPNNMGNVQAHATQAVGTQSEGDGRRPAHACAHGIGFVFDLSCGWWASTLTAALIQKLESSNQKQTPCDWPSTRTQSCRKVARATSRSRLPDIPVNGFKGGRGAIKDFEAYKHVRGFFLTGNVIPGTSRQIESRPTEVMAAFEQINPDWQEKASQEKQAAERRKTAAANRTLLIDLPSHEILSKAFAASNGDEIRSLYSGNLGKHASPSSADMALAGYLAFYCRGDLALLGQLMRESGLCRPKYDEPRGPNETWIQMTIRKVDAQADRYTAANAGSFDLWPARAQPHRR